MDDFIEYMFLVAIACNVLRLFMEEMPYRYGGYLQIQ
jgi:hypothetical protein